MKEVNRKILGITVFLMVVAMLAIPLVSAVGVRRNMSEAFTFTGKLANPGTNPPGSYVPGNVKFVGPKDSVPPNPMGTNPENRMYQLSSGGAFIGVIDSDILGEGVMTSTPLHGLMNLKTAMGVGVFKWKWEFDNEICEGTIEGVYTGEQTVLPGFPPIMVVEGSAMLCKGTGDLQKVKIEISSYTASINILTFTTEGFDVAGAGTIWGWSPP